MNTSALNNYIESFKKGITKKPFKDDKNMDFSLDNGDLFDHAVWQGYLDASRTFHGIKEQKEKLERGLNNLAGIIKGYFTQKDPDRFKHSDFCKCIDIQGITYGQKQKIVNMAFKYLYCCNGASTEYRAMFEPCHMPLDSYTLNWYKRTIGNSSTVWSKMEKDEYRIIQNDIRDKLKKTDSNLYVLEHEFIIWQDEVLLDSAVKTKAVLSRTVFNQKNDELKSVLEDLSDCLQKLNEQK